MKKLTYADARNEIARCAGTQFDREILDIFIPLRRAKLKAEERQEKAAE